MSTTRRLAVVALSLEPFSWIWSGVSWTTSDPNPMVRFSAPTTSFLVNSAPETIRLKGHYTEGTRLPEGQPAEGPIGPIPNVHAQ
ncbi:hypothetical protein ACSBR2_010026 [Camellia fascicularis]